MPGEPNKTRVGATYSPQASSLLLLFKKVCLRHFVILNELQSYSLVSSMPDFKNFLIDDLF